MIIPQISNDPLVTLEGVVSSLRLTTQVSGGGETNATTTHIALFALGETRVELRLLTPPVIFEGDRVRVAGSAGNGVFSALACRNLTTGWLSPAENSGCVAAFMVVFVAISLVVGIAFAVIGGGMLSMATNGVGLRSFIFLPIGLIIPGVAVWGMIWMKRKADRVKSAREMLGGNGRL